MNKLFVFVLVTTIEICCSARILGVFSIPSFSHQQVYRSVMQELANNGHEIVMMTTDPMLGHKNITEIDVHDISYGIWKRQFNVTSFSESTYFVPYKIYLMHKYTVLELVDKQLSTPQMTALLKNTKEHFDLVVVESLAVLLFPLANRFKAPIIGISSMIAFLSNYESLGTPTNPLLYPDIVTSHTGALNFWAKLEVSTVHLFHWFLDWYFYRMENALVKKHYGQDSPTWPEVERQMSVLLHNVNPVLQHVRPTGSNVVALGGVHLKWTPNMTQELKKYLDESKQGVVYVSLGTNILHMPAFQLSLFQEVFDYLPYRIVWKWGNKTQDISHRNIFMSPWLPQRSILAHPNVKAFVTQVGLQSLEEAILSKVPLVALPILFDQICNAGKVSFWGIGVTLDFWSINKNILRKTILDVATNETFRINLRKISQIVNDEKESGLDRAVWWVEHVLRHRGAGLLQAPILPLYEYLLLDVIILLVIIGFFVIILFYIAKLRRIKD